MESFIIIVISILVLYLGFYLFLPGLQGIMYGNSSKLWPRVKGIITKSDVVTESNRIGTSHAVKINYRYWLKRKSYLGKTIGYAKYGSNQNAVSDIGDVNSISNQYAEGDSVEVYYHPNKHYIAVLEPGFSWTSVGLVLLGLGFMFLSATLIYKLFS